jgi:hypothetical protein
MSDELLPLIQARKSSGGILLASAYVDTVWSCLGDSRCSAKWGEIDGAKLKKALEEAKTKFVYRDDDMVVRGGWSRLEAGEPQTFGKIKQAKKSTPKACMDFECVLTSTRKDRDGDVLESKGAELDLSMPLLWQHIPLQPIGKLVGLVSQDDQRIVTHNAIYDNEFGRDVAGFIEFGALRISHGFKPLAFKPLSKGKDDNTFEPGYHVTRFKVLETSVVSVPSNEDAIITLFSRNKLHHPLVKQWAGAISARRPAQVVGGLDKAVLDDSASGGTQITPPATPATCKQTGCKNPVIPGQSYCKDHMKSFEDWFDGFTLSPTKAPSSRAQNRALVKEASDLFGETHDHPKTGDGHKAMCKDGMGHCSFVMGNGDDDDDDDDDDGDGKKAGRVMSQEKLARAQSAFNLADKMAKDADMHRAGKSMMREARGYLKSVVMSANPGVTGGANPGVGATNPGTNYEGKPDGKSLSADELATRLVGHLWAGTALNYPTLCALEEAVPMARQAAEEQELIAALT